MKILNLYAGIGGNRKLWENVEVTAVEFDPNIAKIYSDFFPDDKVIVGDAHKYLLNHYSEFDFIWTSPPCPTHSKMAFCQSGWGNIRYPDMGLCQEILFLKHFFKGKYVVENVVSFYDPLIEPIVFCRHYFWSNFKMGHKDIIDPTKSFIGRGVSPKWYQKALGIDISLYKIKNKRQILRNCVLPELGKHIFDCAMGYRIKETQQDLFSTVKE